MIKCSACGGLYLNESYLDNHLCPKANKTSNVPSQLDAIESQLYEIKDMLTQWLEKANAKSPASQSD